MNDKHKAIENRDPSISATSARLPSEKLLSSNLAQSLPTPLGRQRLSESDERQPQRAHIKVATELCRVMLSSDAPLSRPKGIIA